MTAGQDHSCDVAVSYVPRVGDRVRVLEINESDPMPAYEIGEEFVVTRVNSAYVDGSYWLLGIGGRNVSGVMGRFALVTAAPTTTAKPSKPDMTLIPPEVLLQVLPEGCHDLVRWFHRMPGIATLNLSLLDAFAAASNGNPAQGLMNVAAIGTQGIAHHPDPRDWEHNDQSLTSHYNSAIRHALRAMSQDLDPDSGLPHWWHYAWRVMALWTLDQRGPVNDDRPTVRP
jgi:hypothetical protein